jgi:hypothetical protein
MGADAAIRHPRQQNHRPEPPRTRAQQMLDRLLGVKQEAPIPPEVNLVWDNTNPWLANALPQRKNEELWDTPIASILDFFISLAFMAYDLYTNLWFLVQIRYRAVQWYSVLPNAGIGEIIFALFIMLSELWIELVQRRLRRVKERRNKRDLYIALVFFRATQAFDLYASILPIYYAWGQGEDTVTNIFVLVVAAGLSWYTKISQEHFFALAVETWGAIRGARNYRREQ